MTDAITNLMPHRSSRGLPRSAQGGAPLATCVKLATAGFLIESDLQPTNLGLNSAWLRAQDRSKWRSVVETAMLTAGRAT